MFSFLKKRTAIWAVLVGLSICLGQVCFCLMLAPHDPSSAQKYFRMVLVEGWDTSPGPFPIATAYKRFNNWDSLRYFEIAQNGYHVPNRPIIEDDIHHYRANLNNPPSYPLLTRGVQELLGVRGEIALLIAAQLAAWAFWTYFLLILIELGVSRSMAFWGAGVVAVHPGAFYMVVGYAESTLMAGSVGLIYWTHRWLKSSKSTAWGLAAIHGIVATGARLAGFGILVYPFFCALGKSKKKWFQAAVLSGVAGMGLIGFFILCQTRFGRWDLYFYLSSFLGQSADYLAIFKLGSYTPHYFFETTMASINRSMAPWVLFLMILSYRTDPDWRKRLGLHVATFALFYITVSGKSPGMDGMIRYSLPIFAPLVLTLVLIWNERKDRKNVNPRWKYAFQFGCLFALVTQGWIAWMYLHGRWVS